MKKNLMEIAEAVELNGAVLDVSEHPCLSGRRRGKSRNEVASLSDDSADDSTIMDDNCDDD